MTSAFIEDGYTEERYIKAVERMYPEVRFKFRPILAEDRAALIDNAAIASEQDPKKGERVIGQALADHLVEWSLKLKPVPENIMRLKPSLMVRLSMVILYGRDPGDTDPTKTMDKKLEADATASFSASKPDADLGNS